MNIRTLSTAVAVVAWLLVVAMIAWDAAGVLPGHLFAVGLVAAATATIVRATFISRDAVCAAYRLGRSDERRQVAREQAPSIEQVP
jgi:hypothetical protein